MQSYIALLKGINVGGHNKVAMAELREILTLSGLQSVQTYIQSGNVIFEASEDILKLNGKIRNAIIYHFGFEVAVIVKTHAQLLTIFEDCPFSEEKKKDSYFIMLSEVPKYGNIKDIEKLTFEHEEFVIYKDAIYLYAPKGFGQTKFSMKTVEKKLKIIGTARNYNTMVKLLSLRS